MSYGPVDFLAFEFKTDQLKGEIMPALLELVQNKIVRVIDLIIIQKFEDGHHEVVQMQQRAPDLLSIFDPHEVEISGIIEKEDLSKIADKMENNTLAAALLFENLWAVKFKEAVLRANGQVLDQTRIPHETVEEALAIFKKAKG
jgi:hypothetical protein